MAKQPFNVYTFSFPVEEGDSLLSIKTNEDNKIFININVSEYEDGNRNFEDEHADVISDWTKEPPRAGQEILATNKEGEHIYFDREEAEANIRGNEVLKQRGGGMVNEDTVKAYTDDQFDLLQSYYNGEWTNQSLEVSLVNREGEYVDGNGEEIDEPIMGFTTLRSDDDITDKLEYVNRLIDDVVYEAGFIPNPETHKLDRKQPEIQGPVM